MMEELYLANGHVLLHDDNCYRISYGEVVQAGSAPSSSTDTSSTTLAVQLMDTSRSEAPVSATDPVFNDYIKWVPCCYGLLLRAPAVQSSCWLFPQQHLAMDGTVRRVLPGTVHATLMCVSICLHPTSAADSCAACPALQELPGQRRR